jgi:prepilin-type N-terminal cleavage/methylation domain-containing protein
VARDDGFTLIEVIVALVLLALVLTVIFRVFATGLGGLNRADRTQQAAILAESLLAQFDAAPRVAPGTSEDGTTDGMAWQIATAPYADAIPGEDQQDRMVAVRITVRQQGGSAFTLDTLRVARTP